MICAIDNNPVNIVRLPAIYAEVIKKNLEEFLYLNENDYFCRPFKISTDIKIILGLVKTRK